MTFLLLLAAFALIVFAMVSRLLQARRDRRINPPYVSQGGELPNFFNGHDWPVNPNHGSHR